MKHKTKKILLLGGTCEASQLIRHLENDYRVEIILSLAGVTRNPVLPKKIKSRVGGFGGIAGMITWLRKHHIDYLIDATHPFAQQMTHHAWQAAQYCQIPFLNIQRPAWQKVAGDRWFEVPTIAAAVEALGQTVLRVFLTIGRKELLPFKENPVPHHYWIRSVDRPHPMLLPDNVEIITAKGPFDEQAEYELLKQHHIERIVTKNSGGPTVYAKISAARKLSIPVIMIQRPEMAAIPSVPTWQEAYQWVFNEER